MKSLVVLSGGMDSTTVLYRVLETGPEVECISFDYGQRHKRELDAAAETCFLLDVHHKIVDITFLHDIADSSLTHKKDTPHGHYEAENMKDTVVAGRNLIMASIAMSYAIQRDADLIWLGLHSGDHAIYWDCRPEFVTALAAVAKVFDEKPLAIITPYLYSDKATIVKQGLQMGVDFSKTWTCYDPSTEGLSCGKCGSCQERLEAFAMNNAVDPLKYQP